MTFYDMPDSWLERARLLENVMRESCTGGERDEPMYSALRSEFMQDDQLKALLPEMVRTNRTLASLWGELGEIAGYKGRRKHLNDAFTPIIDHLEGANRAPLDVVAGDALSTFDSDGVHTVWTKALARRTTDPEGAITMARTLLETVCKRVLDERNETYDDRADLPDLPGLLRERESGLLLPFSRPGRRRRKEAGSVQEAGKKFVSWFVIRSFRCGKS